MALAFHTDDKGVCWPSIETLMRECNLCERAVQNQIKSLSSAGLIRVEHGGGKHVSNHYFLKLPNPAPDTVYPIRCMGNPVSHATNPARHSSNPAPDAPQLLGTAKNGQGGRNPPKYVRELKMQIEEISSEIQRLTDFAKNDADRTERINLIARRKQLRKELHYA